MPHRQEGGPDSGPTLAVKLMTARPGEGAPPAPMMERPQPEEGDEESSVLEGLSGRERDLAEAYVEIEKTRGEWSKPGAGYEPRSLRGRTCSECVFYQGDGSSGPCDLVEGPVQADGVCDLYVSQDQ